MRTWRVGTITAGVLCISLGLIWIFSNLNSNVNLFSTLYFLFPITLILLGLEILIQFWLKDKTPFKVDALSIFIIIFLLISSSVALIFSPAGDLYQSIKASFEDTMPVTFNKDITDLEGITEIVVTTASDVKIIGKPETNVVNIFGHAQTTISREDETKTILDKNLIINRIGDQLHITYNTNNFSFIKSNFTDLASSDINITCPENIPIRIEGNNSGNLTIENINNGVTINGNSDSIDLKNISTYLFINNNYSNINVQKVTGMLEIVSEGGEISLKEVNLTDKGKFNIDNGNLKIHNLSGNIKIQSENSDILLDDCIFTGTNTINSKHGNINLIVAEGSDLLISAKINEGEITGDNKDWDFTEDNSDGTLQLNEGTNKLNIIKEDGNLNFSRTN